MEIKDPTGQVRINFDDGTFTGVAINQSWQRHIDDGDALGETIATLFRQNVRTAQPAPTVTPRPQRNSDPKAAFRVAAETVQSRLARPRSAGVDAPEVSEVVTPNCRVEHWAGRPLAVTFDADWAETATAVQLSQAATRALEQVWQIAADSDLEVGQDERTTTEE